MKNKNKIKEIFRLLDDLYCFDVTELEFYKSETKKLNLDDLNSFKKILETAIQKQNKIFIQLCEENSNFHKDFIKTIKKANEKIITKFESEEKEYAENFLKKKLSNE